MDITVADRIIANTITMKDIIGRTIAIPIMGPTIEVEEAKAIGGIRVDIMIVILDIGQDIRGANMDIRIAELDMVTNQNIIMDNQDTIKTIMDITMTAIEDIIDMINHGRRDGYELIVVPCQCMEPKNHKSWIRGNFSGGFSDTLSVL